MIGGIASLWLPERLGDPAYRAFAAYLGASIVTLWVYTAAKSTYLVAQPPEADRGAEPLLPLAAAPARDGARARGAEVNWLVVAAAAVLVLAVSWSGLLIVGRAVLRGAGPRDPHAREPQLLLGHQRLPLVAGSGRRRPSPSSRSGAGGGSPRVAALLVAAWLLTGEIYVTKTNTDYVEGVREPAPGAAQTGSTRPPAARTSLPRSGAQPRPDPLWLTEFWNRRSTTSARSTAPRPARARRLGPGLESADGALEDYTGDPYTLAGPRTSGWRRRSWSSSDGLTLYRTTDQWHLLDEQQNVFADGWATSPIELHLLPARRARAR